MTPSPELTFAIKLARKAGKTMKEFYGAPFTYKDDNSRVTEADTKINQMVIEAIKKTYPHHSILGEEGSFTIDGSVYTWVCDPVDGTLPFTIGIPIAMFSLALVKDGTPILGVLYDPFSDRLFTAETGAGAFMNGEPISVSETTDFATASIALESSELQPITQTLYGLGKKVRVTRMYSATCPGSNVAWGRYDALIFGPTTVWDIAALKVIVEEAGGIVTDRDGKEQRYDRPINGAIVSNRHLHSRLVEIVKNGPILPKK